MESQIYQKVRDVEYSMVELEKDIDALYKAYQDFTKVVAALIEEHGAGELHVSYRTLNKVMANEFSILTWDDYMSNGKRFQVKWEDKDVR